MTIIIITILLIISILLNIYLILVLKYKIERDIVIYELDELKRIMREFDLNFKEGCHFANGSKYHKSEKDYNDCVEYYVSRAKKYGLDNTIKILKKINNI